MSQFSTSLLHYATFVIARIIAYAHQELLKMRSTWNWNVRNN